VLPEVVLELTDPATGEPQPYAALENDVIASADACLAAIERGAAAAIVCREGPVDKFNAYVRALVELEADVASSQSARDPALG
jgi:hypothetical protein